MRKFVNSCLVVCLMACAARSNSRSEIASAPPPVYEGILAGLIEPCAVQDVSQETVASIIESRDIYIKAFNRWAAKADAIRAHDAEARASN